VERFSSECPACHSPMVQITGGDAFRLLYVTLRDR
jgi:Zn finger protein HypA/HybF involved in hydrogenase expression